MMAGRATKRDTEDREKKPGGAGEQTQWVMIMLQNIRDDLSEINKKFSLLDDKVDRKFSRLDDKVDRKIDTLRESVLRVQRVVWIATGVIVALSVISTFLVGFGNILLEIPFDVTIRNSPSP